MHNFADDFSSFSLSTLFFLPPLLFFGFGMIGTPPGKLPESDAFGFGPSNTFWLSWGFLIWAKSQREAHWEAVKEPLVIISAICSLVLTYLINIPGSSRNRSKSQSKSTRCVRGTCLMLRLRPLTIILMTESLSSRMTSFALPDDNSTLVGT